MGLLDLFKKEKPIELKEYPFVLSDHFRGFHGMGMEVHFYPEIQKNNDSFMGVDVKGKTATFKDINAAQMGLWLDGKQIGVIENKDSIDSIRSGRVTAIYLKYEDDKIIGGSDVEIRHRFHLLVKYRD